jgi:hypothetical protein
MGEHYLGGGSGNGLASREKQRNFYSFRRNAWMGIDIFDN